MPDAPREFVPALHFRFLTPFYDFFMVFAGERYFRRLVTEAVAIRDGQDIMDLGCGTGSQALLIRRQCLSCIVTALDYDIDALGLALRKVQRAGIDVRLVRGTASDLPFADGCFDRITSSLVFHHLNTTSKLSAMREVFRALRPSGEFLLVDFGVPKGLFMRFIAGIMRAVERTDENVKGQLPVMMARAGFIDVAVVREIPSPFGTVAFYRGKKPA